MTTYCLLHGRSGYTEQLVITMTGCYMLLSSFYVM